MKLETLHVQYAVYSPSEALPPADAQLVQKAIEMAHKSYSPYSKFPVGAAILLDDGRVFGGNNQENLAYPAGTCAERSVLHYVHANFPDAKIKALAVTALASTSPHPVSPCGICRQVIMEAANRQPEPIKILLHKVDGPTYVFERAAALLPLAFEEKNLGQ